MRAIQMNSFGSPDVLHLIDIPKPKAGPTEILVKNYAAGINFFEVLMRGNRYAVTPNLPMILGVEVAGTIEECGQEVKHFSPGERVALPLFAAGLVGGYAEYSAVDAKYAIRIPDDLTFEQANALMVQGLTALHLVQRHNIKNKTVLIPAASGGVGSLLVQLAKINGASHVIAAASSQNKLDLATSLGADQQINYCDKDWIKAVKHSTQGLGVDIIYDYVGGDLSAQFLEVLAPRGQLIFGALGRFRLNETNLAQLFSNNQSLSGFALLPLLKTNPAQVVTDISHLFNLMIKNSLKVITGPSYPLALAAEAHRAIENRQTSGKINLII